MSKNVRTVSIGEMIVSDISNDMLVAYGLGSCVAVCLYDPLVQVGGMLHALLPTTPNGSGANSPPAKFVDQGVPLLINSMVSLGARRIRLTVQLCGGAQMLTAPGFKDSLNIGKRNVLAAETALQVAGLRIQAQAIGGNIGRTVKLYISNGQVTVKTLGQGEKTLT